MISKGKLGSDSSVLIKIERVKSSKAGDNEFEILLEDTFVTFILGAVANINVTTIW